MYHLHTFRLVCFFAILCELVIQQPAVAAVVDQYTNEWSVEFEEDTAQDEVDMLAERNGFINFGRIGNIESNKYRFVYSRGAKLKHLEDDITHKLFNEPKVATAQQQIGKKRVKKDYRIPEDSEWKKQWSLKNTGQTKGPVGLDINVERAWLQEVTGRGVLVGVVDDGLEWSHPDIHANYESSASHDFANNDADPTPDEVPPSSEPNSHGTGCAGEIAMINNSRCGIGVAYESSVASLKISLTDTQTDSEEASALGHKNDRIMVYSNSWGPPDFGCILDAPDSLTTATFANGASKGRNGKGSIYVWASGNGGWNFDSCAADGYVNSIYTIAVGSADQNGHQADYDENCTAKIAVTYSYNSDTFPSTVDDNWSPYNQIVTLDLNGKCTDSFTGTSASTPLLSAVIALTLQINPDLTWRDIQYLIIHTSDTTKLTAGPNDWTINGAGLKVNSKFGFGAIDAEAMVTRARNWINVPEQMNTLVNVAKNGRAEYSKPFSSKFAVSSDIGYLEHVVLVASMSINLLYDDERYYEDDYYTHYDDYAWLSSTSHARRGDIMIELVSPGGTTSVLLPYRYLDFVNAEGYDRWSFMSLHHWGENPAGTWNVRVTYKNIHRSVTVTIHRLELFGTSKIPLVISRIPKSCDSVCARGCAAVGPQYCDGCSELRSSETFDCVSTCSEDETNRTQTEYNGYCVVLVESSSSPPSFVVPLSAGIILFLIIIIIIVTILGFAYLLRKRKKARQGTRYQVVTVEDF